VTQFEKLACETAFENEISHMTLEVTAMRKGGNHESDQTINLSTIVLKVFQKYMFLCMMAFPHFSIIYSSFSFFPKFISNFL
jgi:hypothetical protein